MTYAIKKTDSASSAFGIGKALGEDEGPVDFTAVSTQGLLHFGSWADGEPVLIIALSKLFSSNSVGEVASLAIAGAEFRSRGVKVVALCAAPVLHQIHFLNHMENSFDFCIGFPLVEDEAGEIRTQLGLGDTKTDGADGMQNACLISSSGQVAERFYFPPGPGWTMSRMLDAAGVLSGAGAGNGRATQMSLARDATGRHLRQRYLQGFRRYLLDPAWRNRGTDAAPC